jgi:KaiC/GvpD/RAD55 family RecA-like ATPase
MPRPSDTAAVPPSAAQGAPAAPPPASSAGAAGATVSALPADIPRAPWSQVAPDFIAQWGYPEGKFQPEHVEILGPSGSGKTVFEETILTERVKFRDSACIFVATKKADSQIAALQACGWPVESDFRGTEQHKQCVFWPRTKLMGQARKAYLAAKVQDLLERTWHDAANKIIAFDEIATIEQLSPEVKALIYDYWREGRSLGITVVAMKQRPQATQRDMHSESSWVCSFRPKDEDDAIRYAEILGSRAYWRPVLMSLQRENYEFILQHARTGDSVISWVDVPLETLPKKHYQAGRH